MTIDTTLPPLMDINCFLGEWPFRRYPCTTVDRLLDRMDRLNIQRAAVSRLENVFFKDTLVGNRELAALIAPHPDRFIPFYTINPAFPGWDVDLTICEDELGLSPRQGGIHLHPGYHPYAIDDDTAAALLRRAEAQNFPVRVSLLLEDPRTHHWLCKVPPIRPETMVAAIAAFPGIRWIVGGARAAQVRGMVRALADRGLADRVKVLFDLSLVQGPIDECQLLSEQIGPQWIAFGTNLPLTIAESPLLALQHAQLPAATKALIARGNAERLLA